MYICIYVYIYIYKYMVQDPGFPGPRPMLWVSGFAGPSLPNAMGPQMRYIQQFQH